MILPTEVTVISERVTSLVLALRVNPYASGCDNSQQTFYASGFAGIPDVTSVIPGFENKSGFIFTTAEEPVCQRFGEKKDTRTFFLTPNNAILRIGDWLLKRILYEKKNEVPDRVMYEWHHSEFGRSLAATTTYIGTERAPEHLLEVRVLDKEKKEGVVDSSLRYKEVTKDLSFEMSAPHLLHQTFTRIQVASDPEVVSQYFSRLVNAPKLNDIREKTRSIFSVNADIVIDYYLSNR